MEHVFHASQFVDLPRSRVFEFFSKAENLEEITPKRLRFEILTPLPIKMALGVLIDYRLRLGGIPFRWRTRITRWEPGVRFVDEQLKGPYALWHHTHRFRDENGGTRMEDEVRYRLPLSPLSEIVHPLVRKQIEGIFAHRQRVVETLLLGGN